MQRKRTNDARTAFPAARGLLGLRLHLAARRSHALSRKCSSHGLSRFFFPKLQFPSGRARVDLAPPLPAHSPPLPALIGCAVGLRGGSGRLPGCTRLAGRPLGALCSRLLVAPHLWVLHPRSNSFPPWWWETYQSYCGPARLWPLSGGALCLSSETLQRYALWLSLSRTWDVVDEVDLNIWLYKHLSFCVVISGETCWFSHQSSIKFIFPRGSP